MKNIALFFLMFCLVACATIYGQPPQKHPSAILELNSTTKAFLPPRMTTAERDSIALKVAGMVLYNTTTKALETYDGTAWDSGGGIKVATATEFAALTNVKDGDAYLITSNHRLNIRLGDFWVSFDGFVFHKGPLDTTALPYRIIESPVTKKIWLDRNIGATRVATSATDVPANGDNKGLGHYFSFNDITTGGSYAGTGEGKICPTGFRLPDKAEWEAEIAGFAANGGNNATGAFNVLKLVRAGYRSDSNRTATYAAGSGGDYWSSSHNSSSHAWRLNFGSSGANMQTNSRSYGFSVRCIKDSN